MPRTERDNDVVLPKKEAFNELVGIDGTEVELAKLVLAKELPIGKKPTEKQLEATSKAISRLCNGKPTKCKTLRRFARALGVDLDYLLKDDRTTQLPSKRDEFERFEHMWFIDHPRTESDVAHIDHEFVHWLGVCPEAFPFGEFSPSKELTFRGRMDNSRMDTIEFVAARLHGRMFALTAMKVPKEATDAPVVGEKSWAFQAGFTHFDREHGLLLGTWQGVSPCNVHGAYPAVMSRKRVDNDEAALAVIKAFTFRPVLWPRENRFRKEAIARLV